MHFVNTIVLTTIIALSQFVYGDILLDFRSDSIQSKLKSLKKFKVKTVYDPAYKKPMIFWAYSCKDLLQLSPLLNSMKENDDIELEASDAYKSRAQLSMLHNPNCYLAESIADEASQKQIPWQSFGHGKESSTPAPYYVIWKNGDDREANKKPWPWSLVKIRKGNNPEEALVKPKNPEFTEGYNLYKQHCIACHSINLVGGKVGFEMNIPKNITEYRSYEFFSSFIVAPDSYRAESKMPARLLSQHDLKAIWSYLQAKSREKIK